MIVKNAVLLEESWWNLIFASFWLLDFKESKSRLLKKNTTVQMQK